MDAARTWGIKTAQDEVVGQNLPPNFGANLGILAILNYSRDMIMRQATSYSLTAANLEKVITPILETVAAQNGLRPGSTFDAIAKSLPGGIKGVRFRNDGDVIAIFDVLKERYNEQQCEQEKQTALQYSPEPSGKGNATNAWKTIPASIERQAKQYVEQWQASQVQQQNAVQTAANKKWSIEAQMAEPGPLSTGRYESLSQLRDELVQMGPRPETYQRIMSLVGPENEDAVKDALSKFFQGLASALQFIYDMLVDAGLASPIDAEVVEKLMNQHPELNEQQKQAAKLAGLFLPELSSGMNTVAGAKLDKTAATAAYPAYESYGSGENRMCPKIRQPVSTYICRYHCLDGLNIDDHQTVCGEAIWRQAVMDKFSSEYRDADGNWVGGYLNKRFETHRDNAGHPALLAPGQRQAPIHEDAWSLEKRMQEMRRSESKKRGYSETPGDPKNLYNFDQHDLMKGPKNPQLSEKKVDPIAKIAETESMFEKKAGDPRFKDVPWARPEPQEGKEEPSDEDLKDVGIHPPKKKEEPWPPKNVPWDKDEKKDETEKACHSSFNLSKNKKASNSWGLKKEAWGSDPMMDNVDHGPRGVQCANCGKIMAMGAKQCDNPKCMSMNIKPYNETEALTQTKAIPKPELEIAAAADAEVVIANDIFRATKNGVTAFGETAEEAVRKLAQSLDDGLADLEPGNLEEQNDMLLDARHNKEMPVQTTNSIPEVAPAPMPEEAPAPVPMEDVDPVQPQMNVADPTPSTNEVPMEQANPVPDVVQGGESEFFPPEVIDQNGWTPDESLPENEGHVSGHELDNHMATEAAGRHPDETTEVEQQAANLGAHPE